MPSIRLVVLSFPSHGPSGGTEVQSDIETLVSHQCHSASVITALTEQDTRNVKKLIPQSPEAIISQANTLLDDLHVNAFKIGLIRHHETAIVIYAILKQHPHIPVILDPVLATGGGTELSNDRLIATIVAYTTSFLNI